MKLQVIIVLIFSLSIFAVSPKIDLNGASVAIENVCFDNGFIRERSDLAAQNVSPVIKKINLDLGYGEYFQKNEVIQSQIRFYNRDSQKYEIAQIDECKNSILSKIPNEIVEDREASIAEAIIYGNLKNHGINDTFYENWSLYKDFAGYLNSNGKKSHITLEKNLSEKIESIDPSSYSEWNDFSKKYVGGEQSGGGSGKIRVSLSLDSDFLKRAKKNKDFLNRFLKLDTTYESVILSKDKLPKSQMFIKEKK
ncbi:hypothetical protein [Bacteriovorax sp. Seq25_V]|uniref:hypothetical protein n=1 Tax=Bacteriovorax sp. Seq25_V TaxID=1201288 RepID=UPI00038A1822|nr:hypothetical protein [Bacteriovorax sp. Seq25_V]EQC45409.1 hypothetical protein M900_2254 [Bacteriovorax sp. Seq25_V]